MLTGRRPQAASAIEGYKQALRENRDSLREWARVVIQAGGQAALTNFLAGSDVRIGRFKEREPAVYSELLSQADRRAELEEFLVDWLGRTLGKGDDTELHEVFSAFHRVGLSGKLNLHK